MKQQLTWLRFAKYFTKYFTKFFIFGLFLTPSVMEAQIQGRAFRDFNANGVFDSTATFKEVGLSGITVTAYNAIGASVGSTTSNATGNYTIAAVSGAVRVEFTGLAASDFAAAKGTGSGTSVQFVTAPITNINFGINAPSDYCQTSPRIVTSCYVEGDAPASDDVLVSVAYTPTGTQDNTFPNLSHEGAHSDLGATYGLAYHRLSNTLFAASYQKRHTKYGSSGSTGAIYKLTSPSDNSITGTTLFLDLNQLFGSNVAGNNPHPVGTNFNTDDASYPLVGKISLGDIAISDDGLYLWAVNLSDRQLYKIPLGSDPANPVAPTSSSQITTYPLYNICDCDGDGSNDLNSDVDVRPFGIELYRGKIYLGIVCSAESTPTDFTKLRAKVFTFDPATGTSTQSLDFGLNYNRGLGYSGAVAFPNGIPAGSGYTTTNPANWRPWRNTYTTAAAFEWSWYDASFREGGYPQPVLVDIEIADNGNMVLGFRDRFGDMVGDGQNEPGGSTLLESDGTGDLLRATLNPDGVSWSFSTTEATNGTEFFAADNYTTAHDETSMGGLALLPGADRFVNVVMDPVTNISAGFDWVQPSNGTLERSYQIFRRPSGQAGSSNLFAKSNGLGDVEFLCNAAPIEIGNRVFSDTDSDGIQDAGEAGIDGVTVKLFEGTTEVGSTTTANGGQYYFTNANVTGGMKYNTAYEIRIEVAQPPLSTLSLTTTDVATNGSDMIDSDGTTSGANAIKAFTTGNAGENNHSYDFGFRMIPDTVNLTLSKTVDSSSVSVAGRTVNFTLKVKNISAVNATGVTVKVTAGTGFTYVSTTPSGVYNSGTGIWTVGAVNAGDSATLVLTVKADSIGVNYCTAEINAADQTDSNSTPNNSVTTEDDIARACVSVPMPLCPNQTYQAALPNGLTGIQWYKNGSPISGATNQVLTITEVGEYTFTANESTCPVEGCCPIKVVTGTCTLPCKPVICLPVAVVRQ